MSYLKRLVLGSAQFSGTYGISNNRKLSFQEINEIIKLSFEKGIRDIEVCSSYGDSQYKIIDVIKKKNLKKKFNTIYKINKIHKDTVKLYNTLNQISKLKAIFSHSSNFYFSEKFQNFIKNLDKRKIKVGVSIYTVSEIENLINYKVKPDLIQLPYNIFNQKFDQKNLLRKLEKNKVQIHVRSIFNQGLVFLSNQDIKSKFPKNFDFFIKFNKKLSKFNENLFSISIKLPLSKIYFKKILIGVTSPQHLDEISKIKLNRINKVLVNQIYNLKFNNSNISDPRKW